MDSQLYWYLIYTKPCQEEIAQLNLQRQNYQTYLPFMQMRRYRRKQYEVATEPMFPRYLFVHLYDQDQNWSPIRSTRGVIKLVRFGEVAAKIPDSLIQVIRQKEVLREMCEVKEIPPFKMGDKVKILDGVLEGYEAIFKEKIGSRRASILLSISNQFVSNHINDVQVDLKHLALINPVRSQGLAMAA